MKFYDTRDVDQFFDPKSQATRALIEFLTSINKKEDSKKLALLLSPSRPLVCDYSYKYPNETAEQRLVRKTLTHEEYPFDFLIPYSSKDWVLTGFTGSPIRFPRIDAPMISYSYRSVKKHSDITNTDMIALRCEKVLCQDNTEAAVRVVAVDRNFKVSSRPLSVIQEKLLGLFPSDTIMVGHLLNKDLKALKMDHARVIDTSVLFEYDFSGCIGKLPRPSLDHLCKSVLGYEMPKSPGRCVDEALASMKLVLAILDHRADTSVPLPVRCVEQRK